MTEITTMFWDVGGVLLTNGWDIDSRQRACQKFGVDREEFEDRHSRVFPAFERGQMEMEQYLARTVFYRPRSFSEETFRDFMFAESHGFPETLALVKQIAESGRRLLATLNNESKELNVYRIHRFRLRESFSVFFSSCFLGASKPDEKIYQRALRICQRAPEEIVFIDDRAVNLECPRALGLHTIHYENVTQLRSELAALGVRVPEPSKQEVSRWK